MHEMKSIGRERERDEFQAAAISNSRSLKLKKYQLSRVMVFYEDITRTLENLQIPYLLVNQTKLRVLFIKYVD